MEPTVPLRNRMMSGATRYSLPYGPFSCHCNIASVQQGSGGGQCVVPFRHEQKGGALPSDGCGGWGGRRLLQRRKRPLRDSQLVRQSRERAGGGIAEAAQRREQRRQQDMDPLVGFALAHAEQPPLDPLNGVGLQVGEQEEQPIFRGG